MNRVAAPLAPAGVNGSLGLTIGGLFRQLARYRPSQLALQTPAASLTYAQLNARVNRLAHELRRRNIPAGACVAVLAENRHEYVEIQLACAKLGIAVACQNWRLAPEELSHCLGLVQAQLLFVSNAHAAKVPQSQESHGPVVVFGREYELLLAAQDDAEPPHAALAEDPWVILYTSGSTGFPKAAAISHRALLARAAIAVADGIVHPGQSYLAWAPMFHIASTDATMITMLQGGKAILLPAFDPDRIASILTREEIGTLSLMPATIIPLIESLGRIGAPVKRVLGTGAMADLVPPHLIAEITGLLDAPWRNSFGATETGYAPASKGVIPVGVVPTSFAKTQSSFCDVRLVDADGLEVPDGEPGEVMFRGPSLFSGYWNAPDANTSAFASGWFALGDVMRRHPDGTLDFVDRSKYLIKSGGENIYPAEIERLLLASERIADAAVVRQAHDHWGEVPVAFVVRVDPTLDEAAVIGICRGRIANYKLPKRVFFLKAEDMPRSALGKIERRVLEEKLHTLEATYSTR